LGLLAGDDTQGEQVCGVEVHPANTGEARVVIAKKQDAVNALKPHMATGQSVRRWYWVATGTNKISRNTPEARLLDRAGIILVGSHLALHLEG